MQVQRLLAEQLLPFLQQLLMLRHYRLKLLRLLILVLDLDLLELTLQLQLVADLVALDLRQLVRHPITLQPLPNMKWADFSVLRLRLSHFCEVVLYNERK